MSRKKTANSSQISIFDLLNSLKEKEAAEAPGPGSLHVDEELRELISGVLKRCPLSRYQVAARMSELAGEEITKSMLDSWTAESKENHRFPAKFAPAFCIAASDNELLAFLCRKAGIFVLPPPEALRAEIRRLEEDLERIRREKQKRVMFLREIEG